MVLGIYGSGGSGKEIKELAEEFGNWSEIVFIDDTVPEDIYRGIRRMPFSQFNKKFEPDTARIVISLGEPEYRSHLFKKVKKCGFTLQSLIHPDARISPSAVIGEGTIVKKIVNISTEASIGENCLFNMMSSIGHDCKVGDHCVIASHVAVSGNVTIGDGSYLAVGAMVKEKICIGCNSVVGMGAVVQRNIPDNVIAMGNPARPMKNKNDSKVFK